MLSHQDPESGQQSVPLPGLCSAPQRHRLAVLRLRRGSAAACGALVDACMAWLRSDARLLHGASCLAPRPRLHVAPAIPAESPCTELAGQQCINQ